MYIAMYYEMGGKGATIEDALADLQEQVDSYGSGDRLTYKNVSFYQASEVEVKLSATLKKTVKAPVAKKPTAKKTTTKVLK